MTQAINYLRASLHRAINQGGKSLTVSTLDLKDALAELEKLQTHQDPARPSAPLVGWADPEKIEQMRQGQRRYLTISRKRGETFTQQVCATKAQSTEKHQGREP
ncbi:MAG: hypothetical protein ACQZ2J_30365 [Pseudomonas piscis]|uniref:hypothetical protein n=1 Tax=Pseudomonas piscis TaxID=2614538 RepID=UPI003D2DD181